MTAENVRVVHGDVFHLTPTERTAPQKHTAHAFDQATEAAETAYENHIESVAWARSVGVEIPKALRSIETLLTQFQALIASERDNRL